MNSTSTVTTTARRIAREHNANLTQTLSGGPLAFDCEGRGGAWYSAGSRPDAAIIFPVLHRRVTARDVQERLDADPS